MYYSTKTVHTYQVRPQCYTTVLFIPVRTVLYCTKKLLLGGAPMIYALYTVHTTKTVRTKCVPSGTLLFIPVPTVHTVPRSSCLEEHGWFTDIVVHYCSYLYFLYQEALAGRSMDDLQTYCTYQLCTQWYTTVHTFTYCTVPTSSCWEEHGWFTDILYVPSAYRVVFLQLCGRVALSTVMWQGLKGVFYGVE